jgi:hypothetical protein
MQPTFGLGYACQAACRNFVDYFGHFSHSPTPELPQDEEKKLEERGSFREGIGFNVKT